MRNIILGLAVSLDGYIEGPNGEYDWCFTDQDYGMTEFLRGVDTAFMGRKTYEMMQAVDDTAGDSLSQLKTYVFSTTLNAVKEGAVLVQKNAKEEIEKLKRQTGKDIWLFGGAGLTTSLLSMGLIDQFWLSIHPIILGSGKPLFSGIKDRTYLRLVESRTYDTGLVSVTYEREL